ncbi:MAG: hypothetical protein ABIP45_04495 [Knoellia sp.]
MDHTRWGTGAVALLSVALEGRLDCDTYAGALRDLSADIAVVQRVIAAEPAIADLRLDGRISQPRGEVVGLWRDLTPHLSEAFGALASGEVNRFDLNGTALTIDVQPSADLEGLKATVAAVVPDVELTLTQGSGQSEGRSLPAEAAQLRADLGALPGVESASFVSATRVVIRVAASTDVVPTVAAGQPLLAGVAPMTLHVTTQTSDAPLWAIQSGADFEVDAATMPEHLDDFAALIGDKGLSAVGWRERASGAAAPMVTITAPTGGDLREVLPLIKKHVPVGADLNLHLGDEDYYFDVAPQLDRSMGQIRELPRTFVETWNALP